MIVVDSLLRARQEANDPIRVGIIGAGFMARGIALQINNYVQGMEVVAIANRHIDGARRAFLEARPDSEVAIEARSEGELYNAIRTHGRAVTDDAMLVCSSDLVDVIVEATGTVEFGASVIECAIAHGKHVVLMNAELDGTLGPLLKARADQNSVVYTNADGDQPGVTMNLYRFVRGIGLRPVLCGNIKGLHDPYRNPTTQEAFAKRWKQKPSMVTSFADGTKISFEQAIVANATGMSVAQTGMIGPEVEPGTPIREVVDLFPLDLLLETEGIVDYVVGADPGPGVFVLGTCDHPTQKHYLDLYKLGPGPLYCFYVPYHLCHFEVPNTIARAVLFNDATIAPRAGLQVEVVATAKTDLHRGAILDGLGHYMTYGLAENAYTSCEHDQLPIGVAEGCRLKRDVAKDTILKYSDVELPPNRLCDALRKEQDRLFGRVRISEPDLAADS